MAIKDFKGFKKGSDTYKVKDERADNLGTAAAKNAISAVTDSTNLVESRAVENIIGWGNKNLCDPVNMGHGIRDNSTGQITSYGDFASSTIEPIKVKSGAYVVSQNSVQIDTDALRVFYYGSNMAFISTELSNPFTIPSNAEYVAFQNGRDIGLDNWQMELGSTATAYEPYHASVADSLDDKCDNSVIGTVENGATASQDYAVGSHFIRNKAFCTVTSAISENESLVGSNKFTSGDVASEFNKQTFIPQTADLNDFKTFGWYYWGEAPTNSPESAIYVQMQIVGGSGIKQIVYKPNAIYIRNFTGAPASWKNWYKFEGTIIS